MPTIIRQAGFEIRIYSQDHNPAHVHCFRAGAELIVVLADLTIRENNGMSRRHAVQALEIIAEHQRFLLSEWSRIHG